MASQFRLAVFAVKGADELRRKLKSLSTTAAKQTAKDAAQAGGVELFRSVKTRAVFVKGYSRGKLRDSIVQKTSVLPKGAAISSVGVDPVKLGRRGGIPFSGKNTKGAKAYYDRWLEFGTKNMAAQPFLRPGFLAGESAAAEGAAQTFDAMIRAQVP